MEDERILLVLTTVPQRRQADAIARALVEEGLAACVSILAPATSVYRWQGAIETASELPLLVKVAAVRFEALRDRLVALHPYEVPEIVAIDVADGLPAYLRWVLDESLSPAASSGPRPGRSR